LPNNKREAGGRAAQVVVKKDPVVARIVAIASLGIGSDYKREIELARREFSVVRLLA
jgi:hypothetical protein